MKNITPLFLFVTVLSLALNCCGPSPSPTVTPEMFTPTPVQPTATAVSPTPTRALPTPTPIPQGETIIIISTADSGPGTLRQALLDAQIGDTITFDPDVFPPNAPVTIYLTSGLPPVTQGYLTIDASNAGVVLEGSNVLEAEWIPGLEIISEGNTIQGLQIINFSGAGIILNNQAHHNTIGGGRGIGSGPMGQGNLSSGNSDGIGLFGASKNFITGNLIGTDATATEAFGNQVVGIFIENGASNNVIGPDNIIAHNGDYGVEVRSLSAIGNTISQNSIHDNTRSGINLPEGGDAILLPPVIFDYDLEVGAVSGSICANCTIEIFSDISDEGEIYEGQTTADDAGAFTLNKSAPFTGPHLTATATDAEGNTSTFSIPVSGPSKTMVIQEGNDSPKNKIQTKRSKELMDNHIADLYSNFWTLDFEQIIDVGILPIGLKRIRLAVNGIDTTAVSWDKSEFSIDPYHDELITRLADNDITIEYVLTFWDIAHGGQEKESYHRFQTEEEFERYEDFVRFIVHHFKDRIEYYEIWNEPEIDMDVETYLELVRRAIPVIREEYPEAKIKVGSVMPPCTAELEELVEHGYPPPPCEPGSRDYLLTVLRSDVMPLVDAVGWHPMFGTSPAYDSLRDYYYAYPSLVQEIKDVASAHGFKGEYAGNELCWSTSEYFFNEPWRYSETESAKYYARGIIMHRGMDLEVAVATSYQRNESLITVRNLCTIMAGAEPTSLPAEIESEAENIKSYSFSLPNGEKLFALWTDGVAVDVDPGVKATLTFRGITADKVMGIDILNSFEQEMITDVEDGTLVVRDLLVKDYPIILRFTDTMSP